MNISFKKKRIKINVKKVSCVGMVTGLMCKTLNTKNLLFEFENNARNAIHSYFVFFPFLAIWLDKNNKVIEFRIVKPFCFKIIPEKPFKKLIEIPLNNLNMNLIKLFVDKGKL